MPLASKALPSDDFPWVVVLVRTLMGIFGVSLPNHKFGSTGLLETLIHYFTAAIVAPNETILCNGH